MNAQDRILHLRLTGVELVESHEEYYADENAESDREELAARKFTHTVLENGYALDSFTNIDDAIAFVECEQSYMMRQHDRMAGAGLQDTNIFGQLLIYTILPRSAA